MQTFLPEVPGSVHLGIVGSIIVTRKARKARRCSRWWGRDRGWRRRARSPSDGGLVRVEPVEPPGQLGASAVLQRVGALLDLIDLLALDLGPPPEHLHTHPSSGTGQTSRRGALWLLLY